MTEIIQWAIGAVFAVLLALFGFERSKAKKAVHRAEKAEQSLATQKIRTGLQQDASQIKDELAHKKKERDKDEKEVIQSISDIPEDKEIPLNDETKKLAADQYRRSHARTKRLQDDGGKD